MRHIPARTATSKQRTAWFRAWLAIAEQSVRLGDRGEWETLVLRETVEAGTFVLELDTVDDLDEVFRRLRDLTNHLMARIGDLPAAADQARAKHAAAGILRMFVEMWLSADPEADLVTAFGEAMAAAALSTGLEVEMAQRRHQTVRVIAVLLAKRTGERRWWDTAVEHGRRSTGLPPFDDSLPGADDSVPTERLEVVELSARWQGLSVAYRNRAAVYAERSDLNAAVRAAEISISLLPTGNTYRGGALMALANALTTLADHADDPQPTLSRALTAYRLAVELPDAGAARRQSRLSDYGAALRKSADLTGDDTEATALLSEAVRSLATALRLARPGSPAQLRIACNLANAIDDRADRIKSPSGFRQALRIYRKAVTEMKRQAPANLPDLRYAQTLLADQLLRMGQTEEAKQLFSEALSNPEHLGQSIHSRAAQKYADILLVDDPDEAAQVLVTAAGHLSDLTLADNLRDDAAIMTLSRDDEPGHTNVASAAARITGCPQPKVGDTLVIQGQHAGATLQAAEGGWTTMLAPTATLSRLRLREARDDLQRPFRNNPDQRPDPTTIRIAVAAANQIHTNVEQAPTSTSTIYVDHPGALLPVSAATSASVTIRPRPWLPKPASTHTEVRWTGRFADDHTLTQIRAEQRALKQIYLDRLDLGPDRAPADVTAVAAGLHIAAHGQRTRGRFGFQLHSGMAATTVDELVGSEQSPHIVVLTVCPVAADTTNTHTHIAVAQEFLRAGALVVVSALWPVRDTAAATFATHFHRQFHANARHLPIIENAATATSTARQSMRGARNEQDISTFDETDWAPWTCWS